MAVRPTKTGSSQDLELEPYDYANRRDAENFCPTFGAADGADGPDSDNDDHNDPGSNTFAEQTADFATQDTTRPFSQFTGDNLIAAPNMVKQCPILLLNIKLYRLSKTGTENSNQLRQSCQEDGHA